jgi:hypothetical protein
MASSAAEGLEGWYGFGDVDDQVLISGILFVPSSMKNRSFQRAKVC